MITDGCVLEPDLKNNHPNYKMQIELQEKDSYILEKLKNELQLTSTNLHQNTRVKNNNISHTASLGWFSTKMANDLAKYGVVPRKTSTAYLPILSDEMMPHLIRGMIDGDGSITIVHCRKKPHLVVYFCGNENTVTQLRDFLVTKLNIFNAKIIQSGNNLWQVSWASKEDTSKICNYIYKDANFFLERKFSVYQNALNNFTENTEVT